jgi:tripartite-type tricarboxylate transporter receptor subunit TctC
MAPRFPTRLVSVRVPAGFLTVGLSGITPTLQVLRLAGKLVGASQGAKLRQGLKGMAEDETFKALMTKLGERIQYMSGEEFEKFWEQDYKKVGTLLRQLIKK